MFSTSARQAAFTAPLIPFASSLSSTLPRATSSRALSSYRCHQRRLSSSKPSSPADGSRGINESQTVASAPAKAKKVDGEKATRQSKKKAKEVAANATVKGRDEALLHLPSVPSTQHIAPLQISASDFFSLYRPISLTSSFPKAVTDSAFAAIFTPRTKTNKPSDVISTLSSTLEKLDSLTGRLGAVKLSPQQEQWNEETDDVRAAITAESYRKAEIQNLDAVNGEGDALMNFPRHILAGRYTPFHPPPAPQPQSVNTPESLAAGAEAVELDMELEPQHRTYTAVLTIEESTDSNGEVTYLAHSSPLVVEEPPSAGPSKFLERMQQRRERYRVQRPEENDMLAISVKRQRKLKMKKHKYKKLMRRTRNLRRRLDRN